jgi:multidrug efflux pump subunit AcrA (membrane-fusion protein)
MVLDINSTRKQVETVLKNWQERDLSSGSKEDLLLEADLALKDLGIISKFLDKIASAVNTFTPSNFDYETTVTGYKTSISSARNEVSTALSDLITAKDKLNTAPIPGQSGQFESVTIQQAKVEQAMSAVTMAEASIENKILRAPFDGIITVQDVDLGASFSSGNSLVSIISNDDSYIEANISEIHIGKIMIGNKVVISFDAFPAQEFEGTLLYIEPGSVLIDGVVNYKIRVGIDNFDPKIKTGLTSNLRIVTANKDNVPAIPLYSVIKEGDQNFVNKVVSNKVEKVPVSLGIIGSDSFVEVVSGLNSGEVIEF